MSKNCSFRVIRTVRGWNHDHVDSVVIELTKHSYGKRANEYFAEIVVFASKNEEILTVVAKIDNF